MPRHNKCWDFILHLSSRAEVSIIGNLTSIRSISLCLLSEGDELNKVRQPTSCWKTRRGSWQTKMEERLEFQQKNPQYSGEKDSKQHKNVSFGTNFLCDLCVAENVLSIISMILFLYFLLFINVYNVCWKSQQLTPTLLNRNYGETSPILFRYKTKL